MNSEKIVPLVFFGIVLLARLCLYFFNFHLGRVTFLGGGRFFGAGLGALSGPGSSPELGEIG
jgi:hypothetical protein